MASAPKAKKRKAPTPKEKTLTIEKIVKLFNAHPHSGRFETCEDCGQLVNECSAVEGYKRELRRVCKDCTMQCKDCGEDYCEGGDYYHEDCAYGDE